MSDDGRTSGQRQLEGRRTFFDRIIVDDPHSTASPTDRENLRRLFLAVIGADYGQGFSRLPTTVLPATYFFPAEFPAELRVPPPPMRGRMRDAPIGEEEGELCGRNAPGFATCLGKLELRHGPDRDGCYCRIIQAPCGYCMSEVPECPSCGWRAEEPR